MNALTPRTDKAVQESNGQWSFAMRNLCIQMECELTKVITERDELVAKYRMHHDEAERITREIAEVRRDRDAWKANHDNQVIINRALRDRPDLGERAKLVHELIQQRDTLAKTVRVYLDTERDGGILYSDALSELQEALAAVKGGEA